MEKKFEDYGFRPSAVIAGLNRWYDSVDKHSLIRIADPDGQPEHYHFFYDHDKVVDEAIKYLRSLDIFYTPGMKWDEVKFKLNSRACLAELGFCAVQDAWPKVNPCFVGPRTERENEIRDHILKNMDANGIKIPESFRVQAASVEDLIAYLFALLMQERKNKELAEEIRDQYCETNAKLQKELDQWERWFERQTKYMNDTANCNRCSGC